MEVLIRKHDSNIKEYYISKSIWPEGSEGFIDKRTNYFELAFKEEFDEISDPVYNFTSFVPAPANISIRNHFLTGIGFQRPKIVASGCGTTFEEAENQAFFNLNKISACEHHWVRHTMSNPEKTMILDGDCSCSKCKVYVHHLQMDEKLFNAMNLAYEAHEGQTRKYNGLPYIYHPYQVYQRVAWWKELPEKQRLLMAKAAFLHDVLEDCPQITKERIIAETDEETYNLVLELTNPSKGSKAPRAVRKQMDRDHLLHASWEAKIIKMFDRIVNLSDMKECPEKDFVALYASESRQLLECIGDADEGLAKQLLNWIKAAEKWSKNGKT